MKRDPPTKPGKRDLQLGEMCQRCGLDPNKPEHNGRQVYVCDRCKALVCSECSENEPNNEIFCLPCDYAVQLGD